MKMKALWPWPGPTKSVPLGVQPKDAHCYDATGAIIHLPPGSYQSILKVWACSDLCSSLHSIYLYQSFRIPPNIWLFFPHPTPMHANTPINLAPAST